MAKKKNPAPPGENSIIIEAPKNAKSKRRDALNASELNPSEPAPKSEPKTDKVPKPDKSKPRQPIFGYSPTYREKYSFGSGETYFDTRMRELEVTSKTNRIAVYKVAPKADLIDGKHTAYQWVEDSLFWEMDNGNIGIRYLTLDGKQQNYKPEDGWVKPFIRWRMRPGNIPADNPDFKYGQPQGSDVHIFFPPALIKKCLEGVDHIKTLYMVEGEFKAYAGSMAGLDIIGLPSMNAYKEKEINALHPDILKAVWQFNPDNIVYLVDADALSINWDKWNQDVENYDLAKRLNIFHAAAKNIREFTKNLDCDVYYADQTPTLTHANQDFRKAKGLDDLLAVAEPDEVIDDLQKLTGARKFFNFINLTSSHPNYIKNYFLLTLTKRVPQQFFNAFRDKLVARGEEPEIEFLFSGFRYKYDKVDDKLVSVGHPDSEKFIRVGPKFYKLIYVPNSKKQLNRRIEPWTAGEITRDYVQSGFPHFYDTILKFDSYCNVPCNDASYQQVVSNCYNLYYKVDGLPEAGEHPIITEYLHHIFGSKIEIGLDYLTLMYREPTQKLPILCLVSKERGTGKSTFYELLSLLFSENAIKIGNDEINDKFNDDWISKLAIFIDEGFIDKKTVLEKIKSLSTSDTANLATKNISRNKIDFFGKFIITSNDEGNFISIDSEEIRFLVLKVHPFTTEDPDLVEKMKAEIPALLQTLKTRAITYPKVSRHWFDHKLLITDALANVIDNTRSYAYKTIKRFISDKLLEFEELEIKMCLWHLDELLKLEGLPYKISSDTIERVLKEELKLQPGPPIRYSFPVSEYDTDTDTERVKLTKQFYNPITKKHKILLGRCYTFTAKDFVKELDLTAKMKEQIEALKNLPTDDDMPF